MHAPHSEPPPPPGARESLLTLFQHRPFTFYMGARVAAMVGQTVQAAVLAWQVYDLTGSALPLAFLGVVRFLPSLAVSFVGGALADTQDRRRIIGLAQLVPLLTSLLLCFLTATGNVTLTPIYICVALLGLAAAFDGPARSSLLPLVVPRARFQRAVALAATVQQLAGVVGPVIGGLIIAQLGVAPAYLYHAGLIVAGLVCLACIQVRAENTERRSFSVAFIKEGFQFIREHPAVLGAMAIDMVAVIFAGAEALLPIYARDILGVGAFGYGLLASAKAIGSFSTAIILALLPPVMSTGRTLVLTILLYGVATIAFGFSTWFPLSLLLYAITASFDQVSVLMRQSIIQLGTPDALRGRVSSVSSLFVGASNQLGPMESGVVAAATGSAVFAVVSGGMACLVGVGIVVALIPSLWRHRTDLQSVVVAPSGTPAARSAPAQGPSN